MVESHIWWVLNFPMNIVANNSLGNQVYTSYNVSVIVVTDNQVWEFSRYHRRYIKVYNNFAVDCQYWFHTNKFWVLNASNGRIIELV